MKAHELARKLLDGPDLPVATYANNHVYYSQANAETHGKLNIVVDNNYDGDYVMIGDVPRQRTDENKFIEHCFQRSMPEIKDLYFCLYDWNGKELAYDGYTPVKLDRNFKTSSMKEIKAPAFNGDTSVWANTHRVDFGSCKSGHAQACYIGIKTEKGDMLYQAQMKHPVTIDSNSEVSILPGDFEIVDVPLW
jgi:hypothetical protein